MSDVVVKAKSDKDIKHGSVVLHALPNGNYIVDNTHAKIETSLQPIINKLDTRFDDVTYYSA